jgi:hypothetical protein
VPASGATPQPGVTPRVYRVMRSIAAAIVLVVTATGTASADSESWRDLLDGKSTAVAVSEDEDEVVIVQYTQSVMYDEQVVADRCPAQGRDDLSMAGCERFAIKIPDGNTDPTAGPRFDRLVHDHGFHVVRTHRARGGRVVRIGRTTITRTGTTITVRRGARTIASQQFATCTGETTLDGTLCDDDHTMEPKLTAAGLTPGGHVVVVFDGLWIAML